MYTLYNNVPAFSRHVMVSVEGEGSELFAPRGLYVLLQEISISAHQEVYGLQLPITLSEIE